MLPLATESTTSRSTLKSKYYGNVFTGKSQSVGWVDVKCTSSSEPESPTGASPSPRTYSSQSRRIVVDVFGRDSSPGYSGRSSVRWRLASSPLGPASTGTIMTRTGSDLAPSPLPAPASLDLQVRRLGSCRWGSTNSETPRLGLAGSTSRVASDSSFDFDTANGTLGSVLTYNMTFSASRGGFRPVLNLSSSESQSGPAPAALPVPPPIPGRVESASASASVRVAFNSSLAVARDTPVQATPVGHSIATGSLAGSICSTGTIRSTSGTSLKLKRTFDTASLGVVTGLGIASGLESDSSECQWPPVETTSHGGTHLHAVASTGTDSEIMAQAPLGIVPSRSGAEFSFTASQLLSPASSSLTPCLGTMALTGTWQAQVEPEDLLATGDLNRSESKRARLDEQ